MPDYGTTFSNATGSGDADNEWVIYPGGGVGQKGGYMIATGIPAMPSNTRATAIEASFKMYLGNGEGDGINYSFGSKTSLKGYSSSNSTPDNYEYGFDTGLAVCFFHKNQTTSVEVRYNNGTLATSSTFISRDVIHAIKISVDATGSVRVSVDNTDYIGGSSTVTAQISNWTTVSQTGWEMGLGGRTGNNSSAVAWVDDFTTAADTCVSGSPLVLDLDGNGIETVGTAQGVRFDLAATGQSAQIGWVSGGDGLLAIDRNRDGQISDGTELFGNATRLANGSQAADGWAALADSDSNGDGVVDAADAGFADLRVWVDANHDGKSDAGELHTLADVGVSRIALAYSNERIAQGENIFDGQGSFTRVDGTTGQMTDVWFRMQEPELLLLNEALHQQNGQPVVDMLDDQAQTLKINLQDLLSSNLPESLKVIGTGKDLVSLDEALVWSQSPTVVNQGDQAFHLYQSQTLGTQLLLDTDLQVSFYNATAAG